MKKLFIAGPKFSVSKNNNHQEAESNDLISAKGIKSEPPINMIS